MLHPEESDSAFIQISMKQKRNDAELLTWDDV